MVSDPQTTPQLQETQENETGELQDPHITWELEDMDPPQQPTTESRVPEPTTLDPEPQATHLDTKTGPKPGKQPIPSGPQTWGTGGRGPDVPSGPWQDAQGRQVAGHEKDVSHHGLTTSTSGRLSSWLAPRSRMSAETAREGREANPGSSAALQPWVSQGDWLAREETKEGA